MKNPHTVRFFLQAVKRRRKMVTHTKSLNHRSMMQLFDLQFFEKRTVRTGNPGRHEKGR